jgi:hypothetical protein
MDLADTFREDYAIAREADDHEAGGANPQPRLLELEASSLQRRLIASERSHEQCGLQFDAANSEVEKLMENRGGLLREHQNCPSLRGMNFNSKSMISRPDWRKPMPRPRG